MIVAEVVVSLLPVLVFLFGLMVMDSYKLVPRRLVLWTIAAGGAVALAAYAVNVGLLGALEVSSVTYSRYVAPPVEEGLKLIVLGALFARRRVGFLVDAAILGFAVGAGFAFAENIYYLRAIDASLPTWIVRGFGTAIMHGGAMALCGVITRSFADRRGSFGWATLLPGLGVAIVIHSAFNHLVTLMSPAVWTALLLLVLPTLLAAAFIESERRTRHWLGTGFDTDQELLQLIVNGEISDTQVGQFMQAIQERFPGEVVADMLCWLRIHLELSVGAKGLLLMRQAGFDVKPDPEVEARFEELRYLEKSIGQTGLRAVAPLVHTTDRELWQLYMLGK